MNKNRRWVLCSISWQINLNPEFQNFCIHCATYIYIKPRLFCNAGLCVTKPTLSNRIIQCSMSSFQNSLFHKAVINEVIVAECALSLFYPKYCQDAKLIIQSTVSIWKLFPNNNFQQNVLSKNSDWYCSSKSNSIKAWISILYIMCFNTVGNWTATLQLCAFTKISNDVGHPWLLSSFELLLQTYFYIYFPVCTSHQIVLPPCKSQITILLSSNTLLPIIFHCVHSRQKSISTFSSKLLGICMLTVFSSCMYNDSVYAPTKISGGKDNQPVLTSFPEIIGHKLPSLF